MSGRRSARRLCRALTVTFLLASSMPLRAQAPGDQAPDFHLESLGGATLRLSDFRGQPVVLNFWATWCPHCREEMSMLTDAWRANHDSGLVVLGINGRDQEKSTRDVQRVIAMYSIPFPILLDDGGRTRRTYRLLGLPTTVFIDAGGIVRFVNRGPLTPASMQEHVREIMGRR